MTRRAIILILLAVGPAPAANDFTATDNDSDGDWWDGTVWCIRNAVGVTYP